MALETIVLSERVHVGHSLNATVFPNRDDPDQHTVLMQVMGAELNFYSSFNTRLAAAWAANQERRANGSTIMPPLALFEFDESIPIIELLQDTEHVSTRSLGRALFSRMAELSIEERQDEVRRLNEARRRKARPASGKLILFDNADSRIATRYDKLATNFLGAIYLVAAVSSMRRTTTRPGR